MLPFYSTKHVFLYRSKGCGSEWISITVGNFIRILIRIRVKKWIRIRVKVKVQELYRLKTEPRRAVDAHNEAMEGLWTSGRTFVSPLRNRIRIRGHIKIKRWTRIRNPERSSYNTEPYPFYLARTGSSVLSKLDIRWCSIPTFPHL
jgi:hypothetical protein